MYVRQITELDEPNTHYKQVWRYRLRAKIYGSNNAIMDMYDNGLITDKDVEMFQFLYDVKVATKEQLLKRCPWLDEMSFDRNVRGWVKDHFMNYCIFCNDNEEDGFRPDAFKIYTIDFSTVTLLRHFSADNDLINWNPRSQVMPWSLAKRYLLATDFRIACETKLARAPLSYVNNRMYNFGRFRLIPNAQIFMNVAKDEDEVLTKPFIQMSFTKDDFAYGDLTRIDELLGHYQAWFEKEGWKSNFRQAPTVWLVADTTETFKDLQGLVEGIAEISDDHAEKGPMPDVLFHSAVRITCKEMFDENLENCFVKYDHENKKWLRTKAHFLAEKI